MLSHIASPSEVNPQRTTHVHAAQPLLVHRYGTASPHELADVFLAHSEQYHLSLIHSHPCASTASRLRCSKDLPRLSKDVDGSKKICCPISFGQSGVSHATSTLAWIARFNWPLGIREPADPPVCPSPCSWFIKRLIEFDYTYSRL